MRGLLRHRGGLILAGILLLAAALALTQSRHYCGWDYHNSLWGPVNMLINGSPPYSLDPPCCAFQAVWMPHTMGFFFWFGLLPCTYSSSLWLLAEICGYIAMIWLFNDRLRPARWIFVVCLLVLFLYPPMWVHFVLGQFSMLFAILMVVIAYLPGSWWWWPLLLALGLTKPQLGILIYPGLVLHVWRHEGLGAALRLVIATGLCAAVMTLPLFLLYPGWVEGFIEVTVDNLNTPWGLPSLFVQLPALIGPAGYGIWGLVFAASLALALWLWYTQDKKVAVIFSLALTPMVTTYTSSWDFMLLLPAFFWLIQKLKTRAALAVLLAGMALVIGLQIAARWHTDISDGAQWWIPPALNGVYLLALLAEHAPRWLAARRALNKQQGG